MLRKVIEYIKEDEFEVRFTNNYIDIINYLKINYMDEERISINYKNGIIKIIGSNLIVNKLLDNEILIKGNFTNIDIGRNNE